MGKQAVAIQQVTAEQRITFAQSVMIVSKRKTVEDMDEPNNTRVSNQQSGLITDNQFILLVINCSDQAKTRTEKNQNNNIYQPRCEA